MRLLGVRYYLDVLRFEVCVFDSNCDVGMYFFELILSIQKVIAHESEILGAALSRTYHGFLRWVPTSLRRDSEVLGGGIVDKREMQTMQSSTSSGSSF